MHMSVSLYVRYLIGNWMDALYIATSEELFSFCEQAKSSHILAVDTEFLREKTYFPKLCLVQVSTGSEIAAIDPLLIDDLTPLKELLEDPKIVKIFHACSQDLEVLLEKMDARLYLIRRLQPHFWVCVNR